MPSPRFVAVPMMLIATVATSAVIALPASAEARSGSRSPALAVPTLESVEPFRLVVGSGAPQRITVHGKNFYNAGANRDQYMHWQIRRDDGAWERCGVQVLNASATCRTDGWSGDSQTLQIGGTHTTRPGFIELRVFHGLAIETETDPRNAPNPTDWSNTLRIPVVVPGPAPVITSLTPGTFPLSGDAGAFRMIVNTSGLDHTAVVVFRGDVVVAPEGMSANAVQVTIPEVYRLTTPGEMTLTVRTDAGGHSAQKYFRFVATSAPIAATIPVTKGPDVGGMRAPGGNAGNVSAAARGAVNAGVRRSEACVAGYVWREATPQDRACVTPESRTRAARQNAEAASRRVANAPATGPAACLSGFVWREAVPGDAVCVTPAERAQTAEDTRLAPSRVVP